MVIGLLELTFGTHFVSNLKSIRGILGRLVYVSRMLIFPFSSERAILHPVTLSTTEFAGLSNIEDLMSSSCGIFICGARASDKPLARPHIVVYLAVCAKGCVFSFHTLVISVSTNLAVTASDLGL